MIINVRRPKLKTGEKVEAFTIYQGRRGRFVWEGYGEGEDKALTASLSGRVGVRIRFVLQGARVATPMRHKGLARGSIPVPFPHQCPKPRLLPYHLPNHTLPYISLRSCIFFRTRLACTVTTPSTNKCSVPASN